MGHCKKVLLDKTFPINDFPLNVCNLILDIKLLLISQPVCELVYKPEA